jgi:ubiquinone/menaquinone biosynthesis C-methylase UbiE
MLLVHSCKDNNFNFKPTEVSESEPVIEADVESNGTNTNVSRAIWQKPGLVIEKLGDVSDKVIADLGAGTGYFSLKLALKAKKVIAIDIEPELLHFIDSVKAVLPKEKAEKIETRLAAPDNPNLKNNEADIILIINTIAYIPNLPVYLQTLKSGLKKGGHILIIDYKMKKLPINAPPKTERIYLDKLEEMLTQAGYNVTKTDDTSLDYQYMIDAVKID